MSQYKLGYRYHFEFSLAVFFFFTTNTVCMAFEKTTAQVYFIIRYRYKLYVMNYNYISDNVRQLITVESIFLQKKKTNFRNTSTKTINLHNTNYFSKCEIIKLR